MVRGLGQLELAAGRGRVWKNGPGLFVRTRVTSQVSGESLKCSLEKGGLKVNVRVGCALGKTSHIEPRVNLSPPPPTVTEHYSAAPET